MCDLIITQIIKKSCNYTFPLVRHQVIGFLLYFVAVWGPKRERNALIIKSVYFTFLRLVLTLSKLPRRGKNNCAFHSTLAII
jgi:hypothetical protein